jgi:predicted O-methyltransferase YrrM
MLPTSAEHDAGKADRLERLRNVEPHTAQVLALLVRATGARRLLKLGTSNGYSTLWLADGPLRHRQSLAQCRRRCAANGNG